VGVKHAAVARVGRSAQQIKIDGLASQVTLQSALDFEYCMRLFDGIPLLRLSARQQSQQRPKHEQAGIRHGLHLFSTVLIVRGEGSLYARFDFECRYGAPTSAPIRQAGQSDYALQGSTIITPGISAN
jgi:hypothetical protein